MKKEIKDKLDERVGYILSKNVADITNEEFEVLRNKWNSITIEDNQKNFDNAWLMIIMLIFLFSGTKKVGDDEDVQ